jgi:galactonate dehydratase
MSPGVGYNARMNRRIFLKTASIAPAGLFAADRKQKPERLEIFTVKVNRRGNWIIPRITTSGGITGLGDASHGGDDQVISLLQQFFANIRERSIFELEFLRQQAQPEIEKRARPAAVALSGIEQCLWDIRGKMLGLPVYEMLGGALQTRIRNYANINRSTEARQPEAFAAMAERAIKAGFDAIKMAPFDGMPRGGPPDPIEKATQLGINCIAAVRRAIGPKAALLVDVHSNMNLERGLDLARRLEPLDLFWLEEVVPARPSLDGLAAINKAVKVQTAGGESIYGVKGFYPYIAAGAVDIIMPDVKYCGGVFELKKISAMGEAAGLPVSPHGPASPIGNLAAAHVCATIPNFLILEHSFGEVSWRGELVDPPEQLANGYMNLSDRPGWGVTLNERAAARYKA